MEKIGTYAFFIGIALSVLTGLVREWQTSTITWTLVILGLIVGLLNVKGKETQEFLVATIALLIVGSAGALPSLGLTVTSILSNLVAFVAPAALIVSLKALWELAED